MKIIGNADEIRWLMDTMMNNCVNCPYEDACNQMAQQEVKEHGEVQTTCRGYLEKNVEFIIVK